MSEIVNTTIQCPFCKCEFKVTKEDIKYSEEFSSAGTYHTNHYKYFCCPICGEIVNKKTYKNNILNMTDKEKLEKLKKLADAMYSAANYLTTDASRLHKAMNEYHKFIIHECKEEPVSEDLEEAAITAADEDMQGRQIMEESNENRQLYSRIFRRGFKVGAEWQKEKDDEEKVLIYKHGFEDCKEQLMAKAVDTQCFGFQDAAALFYFRLPAKNYHVNSEVKVLLIKED